VRFDWRTKNWRTSAARRFPTRPLYNAETPALRRFSHAAEWSRTITGVSTHKALKLNMHRLLERKMAYRAKSHPIVTG
jgi:hypothetical protein